jgi:glucosamine-6-phosphate deaminase
MSQANSPARFQAESATVEVYGSLADLGEAAAKRAAQLINAAIEKNGRARIIAATGNSQLPLVKELVKQKINWSSVDLFHMDEYVGLSDAHPASFRLWIKTRLEDVVHPANTYYLNGQASDLQAELDRYSKLLLAAPIDVAFVGIGENGHIAFNDPHVADFNDPLTVKQVILDEPCRRQQAGEGHFPDVASVPEQALTITCPGLFRAAAWVSCVPEARKAEAVKNSLEGPISVDCP